MDQYLQARSARLPRIVARVRAWIARAGVPPRGAPVVVACSGGPDSTALVLALAAAHDGPLHAVYVDHGLRAGTDAEASLVAAVAARVGATHECARVAVEPRGNLLANARDARYAVLIDVARRLGARFVAVGHTATDQAETVRFRQLRGDVALALAGMPARRPLAPDVELVRPLLDVRRDETAAFVAGAGIVAAADPTNDREALARTRIRRWLAEDPARLPSLLSLADAARARLVDVEAHAAALGPLEALDASAVATAGIDVALALLRRAGLARAGRAHAHALVQLASRRDGSHAVDLGDGLVAERCYGCLRIGRAAPAFVAPEIAVDGPGTWRFGDQRVVVASRAGSPPLPAQLVLRGVRPGDRLRTRCGRRKLQDVLVDAKVPRPARPRVPVLADGSEVHWVGVGRARFADASPLRGWDVVLQASGEGGGGPATPG